MLFSIVETVEKVLKPVEKIIFDSWNDHREPFLKTMSNNIFLWPLRPLKKVLHIYQKLINVEAWLKTVETYRHKYRLKYAYYFYPKAFNHR